MENYVTKEVHDLHVSRLEAIMEKNLAKHDEIATEIKGDIKVINTRIDSINTRIDDMKNEQSQALTKWGIIIAVIVGLGQVAVSLLSK